MKEIEAALDAVRTGLARINGRRRRRRLELTHLLSVEPAEGSFEVVREHSADPPTRLRGRMIRRKSSRTSAALVFVLSGVRYVIPRSVSAASTTGFSDLVWGGRWRRTVNLDEALPEGSLWLPGVDELLVYSDWLEERAKPRLLTAPAALRR